MDLWSQNEETITEIIVIDDCSSDDTGNFFRINYPSVTLLTNKTNLGFIRSCYRGILESKNPWIILLNSDIQIRSNLVEPLIEDINTDPDLFAVSFYSFHESGNRFEGRKYLIQKCGIFKTRNDFSREYTEGKLYDTIYATGGHCLLCRDKFLKLGGFSKVFEPFYWEDADLSYRALKHGWNVYFDPRCKVNHDHSKTIRLSNSSTKIKTIQTRNKLIFFWKNVSSPLLWFIHLSGLLFCVLTTWTYADFIFYKALFGAVRKIPQIIRIRFTENKFRVKPDRCLFQIGRTKVSDSAIGPKRTVYYENNGNNEIISSLPVNFNSILDIGCGAGNIGKNLSGKKIICDGITISEDEAQQAKQYYRNVLIHNVENGLPITQLDSSYDVCICSHVIEHIVWPEKLLRDIRTILLKTNGILIMAVPNAVNHEARMKILRGKFDYKPTGIFDLNHVRWYTYKTAGNLLMRNGFTITKSWGEGKFPLGRDIRKIIPANVLKKIDNLCVSLFPGFFGCQLLYTAKPDRNFPEFQHSLN